MPLWVKLLLILVGAANPLAFALVGQRHFASEKAPPFTVLVYIVSAVALLAFAAGMLRAEPSLWIGLGLALQASSLALFFSAIGATRNQGLTSIGEGDLPTTLVARGPYRWVRHPFYLSYMIFWAACAIMTQSVDSAAAFVIITALYVHAARAEEAKFDRSELTAGYKQYQRRAGFLWPRF